jgi:hypothetical protein
VIEIGILNVGIGIIGTGRGIPIVGIGIVGTGIEEIVGIGTDGMVGEKRAATGTEVQKTQGKVVIPHKAQ